VVILVVFFYVLGTEQVTGNFDLLSSGYVSMVLIYDDIGSFICNY